MTTVLLALACFATVALLVIAACLVRIANRLDSIIDKEKSAIRMFDIERANVYKTHLGEKLKP